MRLNEKDSRVFVSNNENKCFYTDKGVSKHNWFGKLFHSVVTHKEGDNILP